MAELLARGSTSGPPRSVTHDVVTSLLTVLRCWRQAEREGSTRSWTAFDGHRLPDTSYDLLDQHKLLSPYLLLKHGERDGVVPPRELARRKRRRAVLYDELHQVCDTLRSHAVEFAVLRGPAFDSCYPSGWQRDANDLDVVLRHPSVLGEALDALASQGYYVAHPVPRRREGASTWTAVALNKQRPDLENPVYLDVTTPGPAVGRTRCWTVPGHAWDTLVTATVDGVEFPRFTATYLLVLLAVELIERDRPIGRDLLDFAALAGHEPDWQVVKEIVQRERIGGGLRMLSALAGEFGEHELAIRLCGLAGAPHPLEKLALRERVLAVTDRLYRWSLARAPRRTLAVVSAMPVGAWFRLGFPVYAFPPHPDRGPVRGSTGKAVAGLPHYRARIRSIGAARELDALFRTPAKRQPDPALTRLELRWWAERLEEQLASAVPDGEPLCKDRVTRFVATEVLARGARRTVGVRESGQILAAARLSPRRHPLTQRKETWLEGLVAEDDSDGAMQQLLRFLPADQDVRVELPVRGTGARLAGPLSEAGFRPEVLVVRRSTALTAGDLSHVVVRQAVTADADYIYDCLERAVRQGLCGEDCVVDLPAWLRRRFDVVSGTDAFCMVAEYDGERAGHAFAYLRPDRYVAERCGYLMDVFVTGPRGRGISHALTTAICQQLGQRGISMIESDVFLDRGNPDQLREGLRTAGWYEDRLRWHRPAQSILERRAPASQTSQPAEPGHRRPR
jgi:hypothetical protein